MFKKNKVNKIVKHLIISDFFLFFSVGLLSPIFAVFVMNNIENKVEVIGLSVTCYWITRSIAVIPISWILDKLHREKDEFIFMIIGTFLISVIPLFYLIAQNARHVYLIQIAIGFAYSMAVPAWRMVFTKHIDEQFVGLEWSLDDVGIGAATAASAAAGAFIAENFGFSTLFITIATVGLMSTVTLSLLLFNKGHRSLLEILLRRHHRQPVLTTENEITEESLDSVTTD